MRQRISVCAAIVAACGAGTVLAQQQPPSNTDQRLDQFERRLNEMDQRHQAELRARDARIADLERQLREKTVTPTPTADDIERTKNDVLRDLESRNPVTQEVKRTPVSFNPDLAVVGNFRGNVSTNNENPARNRFDVGSVELDLRAAIDPRADGVVILPVSRDVEDPLFFRHGDPVDGGVDTGIDIEEAYIFLHDFGVPNLTAKLGRFHLRFGRQNLLHEHDWPTADNNFVNQSFLGAESLNDSGLSLSYVIPTKYTFGQYVEAIVEVISGEGGGGEAPVLNNDALVDGPALNLHLLWNTDIGRDWNLEVGGSWLTGKHNDDNRQNVDLFGADLTLIHTDPSGRFNNQLFMAEAIYGNVDTSRTATQHSLGAYVLAQQQLSRDWYLGARLDWTKNALDERQEVWGVSPYVSWYWSEFLRFRLEYQHKGGDVKAEDTLYFQVVFIYGAHPPHPYWAMR
jgi:hypothetical protein